MCAEAANRPDSNAEGTVRLSAVPVAEELISIARYRILSELGRGAMARVYLALDPNINRKIALKVLEPRGLVAAIEMDELRTRFLLEARAAGNLRHPSAVAIYDADHDPDTGLSFIAMEWVDGQSLDHLLKQEGPLTPDQAIKIVCQMAGALDAAHGQGLIHRDVKPANILLDRQGNAKLSDFGIAKAESLDLTSTGQVLGTPFYMSPEQIRDEDLDGRSDLFSLGVVLYQCLTGQQPFHAASLPAVTHKILHVDPSPPQSLNAEIPQPLASIVVKALEKSPVDRFHTGAELAEALGVGIPSVTATVNLTQPSLHAWRGSADSPEVDKGARKWGLLASFLLVVALIAVVTSMWKNGSPVDLTRPEAPVTTTSPPRIEPQTEAVSRAADVPNTVAVAASTLQISYTNRLKKATLDVWIDDEHILTKPLKGPRGVLKRAVGTSILESIPISKGRHDIRVSIRGNARKIEASNWTTNTFAEGQTRRLRVELIPPSYLNLAWK